MTSTDGTPGSAEQLAAIALQLHSQHTVDGTLNAICRLAVAFIPDAEDAAISIVRGRGFETIASTGERPRHVDRIQYETSEGPCLDAIREHDTFVTGALAEETRWPEFSGRAAAATGVSSMASFRLFVDGDTLGALNLYSKRGDAFSERDVCAGSLFAAHAAVAYADAKVQVKAANLEIALVSARRIGMALGILMALGKLTDEQAFGRLQDASQRTHRKLRDIADDVIVTGALAE